MHCSACDKELSDFESTRKINRQGVVEYPDLCNKCFSCVLPYYQDEIVIIERQDLETEDDSNLDIKWPV